MSMPNAPAARPLLLRGGRVVDPSQGLDEVRDLLLEDGVVRGVARGAGAPDDADVRDVAGLIVCPG
ncbi:MAG: hypothetical protein ACRELV_11035, partial [Longimicrobiales bacterium]